MKNQAGTTIVKMVEAQVAKTPDAPAVRFAGQDLSYAQLNSRANQLAHYLQRKGVRKDQQVGLFLERSLEMVIGILGVLKAGGAYVPIDPDHPAARVAFMLQDTEVPLVLSQSHLSQKLSTFVDWEALSTKPSLISLDAGWHAIARESTTNPQEGAAGENLAYTIYTSGSTGQPKGVMNEHRGIFNRMEWMRDHFKITENDRILQKTPYSFDVSIWEFFWPLISGAQLVMAEPGGHKDSDYLVNLIIKEGITATHFVPSMLQVFLLHPDVEGCTSLKRVLCSGEALPFELQERFFARLDADLYNLYGPTEAAIEVTCWPCRRGGELSTVPIGRPLANTQIHLLDSELKPVPPGEPGELHIGGVQVARGYLNRPDLTAEKFIPDPFSPDPHARLYRTGDLARYLPDGNLLYLGRMDHQVKIRGNRVELGEIEATLMQHPGIREAVVITQEIVPGDKRLAAYIVPDTQSAFSLNQVRQFLAARLPEYMLPATYSILDSLPLTSSGKVDRNALPAPNRDRPELNDTYVGPRDSIEETLAGIWEGVIGLDRVGVHDNFLELGGDSILSIQISSRANEMGLHITPGQVLQCQTIAQLADMTGTVPEVEVEQGPVTGTVHLTPIQQLFFEKSAENPDEWTQSILLEARQTLDPSILERATRELLIHHDALRIRFNKVDTGWQQEIAKPEGSIPFSHVDLSRLPAEEQAAAFRTTIKEEETSLHLSDGPLLRAALIELGQAKSFLHIVVHHLAVDSLSWRILLEHLGLLYRQLRENQSVQLPPKTTSYQHWARRLTELQSTDHLHQELPFWVEMLDGNPDRLPVDHAESVEHKPIASVVSETVSLNVEDTHSLLFEVPKAYRTLITDVLLSALLETFSRWTGQSQLQVDIEGHGREEIFHDVDLSQTVGCCSAVYPVRMRQPGQSGPGELLIGVKEQLRSIPHGGIGYGLLRTLREEKSDVQELQAASPSEVSFHYLGQLDNLLGAGSGFRLSPDFHGPTRTQHGDRQYLLRITSGILQGQLFINWTYSRAVHKRTTIEALSQNYVEVLKSLIGHCTSPEAGRYTPSDFPEANLSQEELDHLLEEIDAQEG